MCVIGDTVRKKLFGGQNPIGVSIRLGKLTCRVIGVLTPKGQSSFGSDQDDTVIVSLRTLQRRMAIGALEREVLMQFLVEAVVLSCFGGIAGILLDLSAAKIGSGFLEVPFIVDPGIGLTAFLVSAAVGVVFGYFRARKAARLDPIDALRHE